MKKGFTLIEVLVTALISSFVLLGVATALTLSYRLNEDAVKITRAQQITSFVHSVIGDKIRKAKEFKIEDGGLTLTVTDCANTQTKFKFNSTNSIVLAENGEEYATLSDFDKLKPSDVKVKFYHDGVNNSSVWVQYEYKLKAGTRLVNCGFSTSFSCRNI